MTAPLSLPFSQHGGYHHIDSARKYGTGGAVGTSKEAVPVSEIALALMLAASIPAARRPIVRLCVAIVIVVASAIGLSTAVQAQDGGVPCDSFIRNPDGSWTATGNVAFPGPGQNINLRQGSVLRPGLVILGTDVAATLTQKCASVPVQQPQVELSKLADAGGSIDMQTLTCGQLADTYQEDADFLLAWYSGWSNGLAKMHTLNVKTVKDGIHNVIVYCKANKAKRVSEAIAIVAKQERQ
jgi:hypothetical protein